ncbi:hypothetical protein IVU49_00685 [Salmonella enterica subsp. enterica serovar Worthington]|nr:hypothetical protein [Salmonella enterica subsp. enterica serovar Worthington]MBP1523731.1 hypothetical protein [Salmonella enterica subsp. enterica serovar Worthington]
MANFHAIVNLPGLLTKMGVKYRRFSTIETKMSDLFSSLTIRLTPWGCVALNR